MQSNGWQNSGLPVALRMRLQGVQDAERKQHHYASVVTRAIRRKAAFHSLHGWFGEYQRNPVQQARIDKFKRDIKRNWNAEKIQKTWRGFKGRRVGKLARSVRSLYKGQFDAKTNRIKKRVRNYNASFGNYSTKNRRLG